jgi:hypothetical protein
MRMTSKIWLFTAVIGLGLQVPLPLRAQDKIPVKFGKVTPDDFKMTATALDTGAEVIVVADFGSSSFQGDGNGGIDLTYQRFKRIRMLKRSGFDAATITIPLYVSKSEPEILSRLKASTYVLEDGKVVETKLDSKSIFIEKLTKNLVLEKFTFPALKEGAILEYSYRLSSNDLFFLRPWEFQGRYPCLWSEYQIEMPDFLKYATLVTGPLPFKINSAKNGDQAFHISSGVGGIFSDNVVTHRWVMTDVPAMKEEPFTTTIDNYTSKIQFQLSGIQIPGGRYHNLMGNWFQLADELLQDDYFGAELVKGNGWMDDDMNTIVKGAATNLEKAQRIFAYVRDNFTCSSHSHVYLSNPLKTTYKNKNGNESDINLLLTAMLIHAGLPADPIILSTRDNGFADPLYPLLTQYNYVISQVLIDSVLYRLDASEPWAGFGRLPEGCYNGSARVINKDKPYVISLSADSLVEGSVTLAIVTNDEKGGMNVRLRNTPGYQEAERVRQDVKEHGQQAYLKKIQAGYAGDASISDLEIDSLQRPDDPLGLVYDLHLATDSSSDLYYFNPMLAAALKENPFKAAVRTYPVEMPCGMDETYTMIMDIPSGYVVDEVPKSAKVSLNTDEGFFEYFVVKDANQVQMRSRIKLKKANFAPDDYSTLRDFFAFIVKKEGEQIVFKKKK